MNSFEAGFLERQAVSQALLQTIRTLGEYKGKQELFAIQVPQVLRTLREAALIHSTEASNRIEGVVASPARIRAIVERRSEPQNRSEQEIAGYRDVLNTIHAHHADMDFTPNLVLQLHRDLFQFTHVAGGNWKITDNTITERHPDGKETVRFTPVSALETPGAMAELHDRCNARWNQRDVEPLLLIPAYVLDFLCIHPFLDGNGRMARLLTLFLLYRAGYEVGRYISLEALVEQTKDSYYDTLHVSSQGWHQTTHALVPWWEYFLGVMLLKAYRELEARVGATSARRGAKRALIVDAVHRLPEQFRYADVTRLVPSVSRPTINRALRDLRQRGEIRCLKPGRDAIWEKIAGRATSDRSG